MVGLTIGCLVSVTGWEGTNLTWTSSLVTEGLTILWLTIWLAGTVTLWTLVLCWESTGILVGWWLTVLVGALFNWTLTKALSTVGWMKSLLLVRSPGREADLFTVAEVLLVAKVLGAVFRFWTIPGAKFTFSLLSKTAGLVIGWISKTSPGTWTVWTLMEEVFLVASTLLWFLTTSACLLNLGVRVTLVLSTLGWLTVFS